MDSAALRSSPHQVLLLNPVWIRSTAWKWLVLLLLLAELEDPRNKERVSDSEGVRVDAMLKVNEVVEAVPVATQWM